MTSINYDHIPSGLSDDCFEEALASTSRIDGKINYQNIYSKCIENPKVYDEKGIFIPYSTIINTIEDHRALCSSKRTDLNIVLAKNDRRK
jgi:hypothetical protein